MFYTRKKIQKLLTSLFLFSFLFCVFSVNVFTQEHRQQQQHHQQQQMTHEFTDDEIRMFASAVKAAEEVQQDSHQKIQDAIEAEGMTMQEFNQTHQKMQNPDVDVNPEKQAKFENAFQKVNQIQAETDGKIREEIEEAGLDYEKYHQIMNAYRQDPELQQKVNEHLH